MIVEPAAVRILNRRVGLIDVLANETLSRFNPFAIKARNVCSCYSRSFFEIVNLPSNFPRK